MNPMIPERGRWIVVAMNDMRDLRGIYPTMKQAARAAQRLRRNGTPAATMPASSWAYTWRSR